MQIPKAGDIIYVPSYDADLKNPCGWTRQKKKGGWATVATVQKASESQHLIFVTEYVGFGMWWETDLKDKQTILKEKYGYGTRAQILLF